TGRDAQNIILLIRQDYLEWCLANSTDLQLALLDFAGEVLFHMPSHKFLQLHLELQLIEKPLLSPVPFKGLTVFTDGSGRTGKAVVTWKERGQWRKLVGQENGSPQLVELRAAAMAFQHFSPVALNWVTDSAYVAGVLQCLDHAALREVNNHQLFYLLKLLWYKSQNRAEPYYVLHVRSHTGLPGFMYEGNAQADALAASAWAAPVPDKWQQALSSHAFFHQGMRALQRQFDLTSSEAKDIIASC
ncbi:POK19 protein, partial [Grallaria varia]|nr:POK19 protein [Grallaria varia]